VPATVGRLRSVPATVARATGLVSDSSPDPYPSVRSSLTEPHEPSPIVMTADGLPITSSSASGQW
jgi:hypothetical protein